MHFSKLICKLVHYVQTVAIQKSGLSHSFTYGWHEAEELAKVRDFLNVFDSLKATKTAQFYN